MQDDALRVQQTLAGDRQAFGFLVRKYWRPIYAQILSVIHNHADAEELTNDAFIEAYLDLINLRRPSSFHNWLRQIARHRCLDWLRQRKETSLSLEDLSDEVEAYLYGDSVEDQLLRQEQTNKTLEAIGTLPEIDRCLMRDFYLKAEPGRR
jgi:RNA polymerase sigma-70 factor (ECF subfamily)